MKKSTYPKSQNSVVLSAADLDTMEHLLRSTISAQDKDGVEVVITKLFHFAKSITEEMKVSTALGQRDLFDTTGLPSKSF
jgi:hypothetical protein